MKPTPEDLAEFVGDLDDELLLPALWLVRHSALGAILRFHEPDEGALKIVDHLLLRANRQLYDFVRERMEEN